ncbi:MAG: hypothetical protein EZS28_054601, partial [Streblomastix strix]
VDELQLLPKKDKLKHLQIKDGVTLQKFSSLLLPERRVIRASIQAPRLNPRGFAAAGSDDGQSIRPHPPYAWEGREYVRQLLLGRIVNVQVEYHRTIGAGGPTFDQNQQQLDVNDPNAQQQQQQPSAAHLIQIVREYVSVTHSNGEDLAVSLVKEGFARPVRHRKDEPRAGRYTEILKAEEEALKEKRRIFHFDQIFQLASSQTQIQFKQRQPWSQITDQEKAADE